MGLQHGTLIDFISKMDQAQCVNPALCVAAQVELGDETAPALARELLNQLRHHRNDDAQPDHIDENGNEGEGKCGLPQVCCRPVRAGRAYFCIA